MKQVRVAMMSLLFCPALLLGQAPAAENRLPDWALGGFVRPEGKNPVITPNKKSSFYCPMRKEKVGWEESDTFNPAAVAKDGKIYVLYRAEDNSSPNLGERTSRLGLAESEDGIHMTRRAAPVLFPADDNAKQYEWPGGCEDPRLVVTEEGTYVVTYTSWNHDKARLSVATSRDLVNWTKHGLAFGKAYGGRFDATWSKSASIVTEIKNGCQVAAKINGKYVMYWGEFEVAAATSNDLINWQPVLDNRGELLILARPREGYFDSRLVECGPPAILTDKGIVLLYNGKNRNDAGADKRFPLGTYSAGQLLLSKENPFRVIARLDVPFFYPQEPFEKSGQYKDGTVFVEGLVFHRNKWFLYYGCADSQVGVAVYDPLRRTPGDPVK